VARHETPALETPDRALGPPHGHADLELRRLRAEHEQALLAFERENREYFAASVPDRGDSYFAEFSNEIRQLLAWQAEGTAYFHVLTEPGGAIVGRINLTGVDDGSAELGYRIAECAAGRGLATAAVLQICELAASEYGLRVLHADARVENVASTTVLARTGFVPVGRVILSDLPGVRFRRELSPPAGDRSER
jgi:[ribosomal protein S5]-alanine N-acetyltransferase